MERLQPPVTVAVPVSALVLAAGAAASFDVGDAFGFVSDASDDVFVATWLLGWVLLVWAAVVGGGYAVLLGWRLLSRLRCAIWKLHWPRPPSCSSRLCWRSTRWGEPVRPWAADRQSTGQPRTGDRIGGA